MTEPRNCPLLEALDITLIDVGYGCSSLTIEERNLVKKLCTNCPVERGCFLDSGYKLNKGEEILLLQEAIKRLKEELGRLANE